jgi:lipoprotein NlpD
MSLRSIWPVIFIVFAFISVGCSSNGKRWDPTDYTVKSGDTLYSIAWRYELDAEQLAAWNDISTRTRVKAGQRLHTREPSGYRDNASSDRAIAYAGPDIPDGTPWVKAKKGDTLYSIARRSDMELDELAMLNQLDPPYIIHPGQTIFLQPLSSSRSGVPATTGSQSTRQDTAGAATKTTKPATKSEIAWPSSIKWQKPVQGKIVNKFDARRSDSKGIDIAGRLGDPVLAAAPGKVVYSGDGLISYGNLVIIKHNKQYLSAYAYNQKLLVKEGDVIKAGQQIATMGRKDNAKPMLHFEIRRNGKPVNPLKYLPW